MKPPGSQAASGARLSRTGPGWDVLGDLGQVMSPLYASDSHLQNDVTAASRGAREMVAYRLRVEPSPGQTLCKRQLLSRLSTAAAGPRGPGTSGPQTRPEFMDHLESERLLMKQ